MLPLALLLTALMLGGGGCAHRPGKRPVTAAAAPAPHPTLVGTISLVDEAGKFVLIDSGSLPSLPEGLELKSYTAGVESAELITTQVRKHPFAIADIRSGQPRKGDRVQMWPVLSAAPALVPPQPAAAMAPPPAQ